MRENQPKTRRSKERVDTVTGVAWFDRQQWEHLRQVAADPERLEESYEEWVAMVERTIFDLEAKGLFIKRVPIDTTQLVSWCGEQGRPIDGRARAEFAARELHRRNLFE